MMSFVSNLLNFENPWDTTSNKPRNQGRSSTPKDAELSDLLKQGQKMISEFLTNKGDGKRRSNDKGPVPETSIIIVLILGAFFVWLATGFYTVDTDEEGIVMRFGCYHRAATPGLNYRLPYPIEAVDKLSVTRINKEIIGLKQFPSRTGGASEESELSVPKESQMLTGDENIIEMHFFVQWYIKDAKSYLFNIKDVVGESTIRVSAESVMRQIVGRAKISEALSEQRQDIEKKVQVMLQDLLDSYGAGIEVVNVGILYSYVAPEVRDAYRDIQSAKADKEREINEALAYRNDIIPRARGEAKAIIEEAKGYRESVVSKATGEAQRFKDVLSQYRTSKEITKHRLYIDAMEQVLKGMKKIVIDKSVSSKAIPLLSMNELMK